MFQVRESACLSQVAALCFLVVSTACGQEKADAKQKQPITPADGAVMARVEVPYGLAANASIAQFSPDGKRFFLLVKKGNLERNTNEFSLLVYRTADVFHSSKPDSSLVMSSSSNRDAITKVRWQPDNETLVFLGENPGEGSQIYTFNATTGLLKKMTNHPTPITSYDTTGDGREMAYIADPPKRTIPEDKESSQREVVIAGQSFERLMAGDYSQPQDLSQRLFTQVAGEDAPRRVPIDKECFIYSGQAISLSPRGTYIVFSAPVAEIAPEWTGYEDLGIQLMVGGKYRKGTIMPLEHIVVWDAKNMSLAPLVNAPGFSNSLSWTPDEKSVFLESYLPLDILDPAERKAREQNKFPVEVKLPSRELRKVRKEDFPTGPVQTSSVEVTLDQDLNTPPKIYVSDPKTQQKRLLLDLNPRFSELDFGAVKTIEWMVDGVELIAGLYLPPDYSPGQQYPLVIQTHGFEPTVFSMDGRSEWTSAYAARALAAKGIIVLQFAHLKNHAQMDRAQSDKSLGDTVGESILHFDVLAFETVIDQLDRQGLIDRNRVGVSGFSRWVCLGGYILTHSKYRFAAASLVDGVSCGYFEEVAVPEIGSDMNFMMGGAPPIGEGLKLWMKNSPGFNLDRVQTPVQLAAFGGDSLISEWEWFTGLSLQSKPVDFVYIPDAIHIGVKPSERVRAQERILDWFTFWLKGEENPDPAKAKQYARWRELRKLGDESRKRTLKQ